MGTSIRLDTQVLDKLDRDAPGKAHKVIGKIAWNMVADVQTNFSNSSPSAEGDPPGIDTGNLKNNIRAEAVRDRVWKVIAATDYAADLEYGTIFMAARPFIQPSAERIAKTLPAELKAVVTP